jgi:hypothetical protein
VYVVVVLVFGRAQTRSFKLLGNFFIEEIAYRRVLAWFGQIGRRYTGADN